MNHNRVIQVLPSIEDEMVLFVSQKKAVRVEQIAYWAVVEKLDYNCKWERMGMTIRPIIEDTLGYKLLEDANIVAVKVSGSQRQLEKEYAKDIKMVIAKLEKVEE